MAKWLCPTKTSGGIHVLTAGFKPQNLRKSVCLDLKQKQVSLENPIHSTSCGCAVQPAVAVPWHNPSFVFQQAPEWLGPAPELPTGNGTSVKRVLPPTYVKAPGRIVAVGDIHGDLTKAVKSLELAGVLRMEDQPVWVGGDTTVVQLGDVLDRGDSEIAVLTLLRGLDAQARQQGGAVYMLNGNHESLNVAGNFRYVTPGAFRESAIASGLRGAMLEDHGKLIAARVRLFMPGGPLARELAKNPSVLKVNDIVFAHGGLLPNHVTYGLDKINREVSAWMRGERNEDGSHATPSYVAMGSASSVMWNRSLGHEAFKSPWDRHHACTALRQALASLSATKLVVGHTVQTCGANCECDGQVWRVDVGMSSGVLNALPQVLEITQDAFGQTTAQVKRYSAPPAQAAQKPCMLWQGL